MTAEAAAPAAPLVDVVLAHGQFVTLQYLNANDRGHWRTKEARRRYWLDLVPAKLRQHGVRALELPGRAHIVVTFAWPDQRRRDVGNLQPTAKVITDAVVRAGVLPDDHDGLVVGPDCRRAYGPHSVRLTITHHMEAS